MPLLQHSFAWCHKLQMLLICTICYVFRYEVLILQRAPHTVCVFFFIHTMTYKFTCICKKIMYLIIWFYNVNVIQAGDFNVALNPLLDREGNELSFLLLFYLSFYSDLRKNNKYPVGIYWSTPLTESHRGWIIRG